MVAKKGFFTRTWVAAVLAGAVTVPALGAVVISDDFNDTNTTAPQATDPYWLDATVTDHTAGVGGYTAGTQLGLFNLWMPMATQSAWIQETGGKLILSTHETVPDGAAIYTNYSNSLNFFDNGLQIMVRGVDFIGTSHPSYQFLKMSLSPSEGSSMPSKHVTIMLNGENMFSMSREENRVITGPGEIVSGAYIPTKIRDFDLRINGTRYEVVFYWDGGAIYYCGNHGLVKQATDANGTLIGGWQVPTSRGMPLVFGPSSLMLYAGYRGPTSHDPAATQVSIDNVTVSSWVTTPTTPSMCAVPAPQ